MGSLAVRDAGQVKHRVLIGQRVEAGVIAEWPLAAQLAQFHVAFQNNLRMGWHFEIDRLALHDLYGLAAQKAGDHELLHLWRRGNDRRKRRRRIGPDRNRHFKPRAFHIAQRNLRQPARSGRPEW